MIQSESLSNRANVKRSVSWETYQILQSRPAPKNFRSSNLGVATSPLSLFTRLTTQARSFSDKNLYCYRKELVYGKSNVVCETTGVELVE